MCLYCHDLAASVVTVARRAILSIPLRCTGHAVGGSGAGLCIHPLPPQVLFVNFSNGTEAGHLPHRLGAARVIVGGAERVAKYAAHEHADDRAASGSAMRSLRGSCARCRRCVAAITAAFKRLLISTQCCACGGVRHGHGSSGVFHAIARSVVSLVPPETLVVCPNLPAILGHLAQ